MNRAAHWLSAFSALMHLLMGVPELLRIGPRFLPASWAEIYGFLPEHAWWLWPGLFVVTGLVAALGVRDSGALRFGFRLSSYCFFAWGMTGLHSWSVGSGGNIPGSSANLFIAGCTWVLAHYVSLGERGDVIDAKVELLAGQLQRVGSANRGE